MINEHQLHLGVIFNFDPWLYGRCRTQTVTTIANCFTIPWKYLNVVSIPKGMAYGALQHTCHSQLVCDYDSSGTQSDRLYWPICEVGPGDVLHCPVQFILLVEKEATFHHLVASRFCDRHGPCLVVTGRGYPDVCTREFLHHLMCVTEPRGVPIVALTDGDPHGIEILCTYKFGSKALGFDSAQLAVPTLRWFGIHRYDIDRIPGCQKFLVPLSNADVKKAESLLRRHDIQLSESWK
ncbi:endodeoxyribonuclease [Dispira simplex]|nr:endodeoxyribonuclease [Dispira simplex]